MKSLCESHIANGKLVLALLVFVSLFLITAKETNAEKDKDMEKNRIQIYAKKTRVIGSMKVSQFYSSAVQLKIIYFRSRISENILNC